MATFHDRVVQALDFSKAEKVTADDIAAAYNKVHGEMVSEFHAVQGVLDGDMKSVEQKVATAVRNEISGLHASVRNAVANEVQAARSGLSGVEAQFGVQATAHPWLLAGAGVLAGLIAGLAVGSTFLAPLVH